MANCEFKKCTRPLGPGAAKIGYLIRGKVQSLKACAFHTTFIMSAPRGTYIITEDRDIKPIPAVHRTFII